MNPDIVSNVKYSPPVSKSPVWVPKEKRLIIDIWRKVDKHSWLLGNRMLLSRQSAPWDSNVNGCLCTWRDSNDPGSFYALLKASSLPPLKSCPIQSLLPDYNLGAWWHCINCLYFVSFHGDLGPTNVLVNRTNNDSIGLVDWEYAAFVPKSFIPIHVQSSAGYNLDIKGLDKRSATYAKRLAKALK
ncbi:hypothetical protein GGR58DRAFT_499464 [Xylaria digitata]|nr:hypothetical protein GGR58DRAFT_499464 [Xylaria digitata]